jgi:hypothetical protein
MRIYYSDGEDPMLLDTRANLRKLGADLLAFLESTVATAAFSADVGGVADPYDELLLGLRLQKINAAVSLQLTPDRWLLLSGEHDQLAQCSRKFLVKEEDGHVHLYTGPVSLIIESESQEY